MVGTRGRKSEREFQDVLERAVQGDGDAFAAIWCAFNPPLIRFLRGLADNEDAVDVASTVWLEVVRGLDRFEGAESGFRAWLFTMARHRLIDLSRSRDRRPQLVSGGDEPQVTDDHIPGPEGLIEQDWSTEQAVAFIGSLPSDQAEVLLLRVVADLDVATVAEMLGKRPGTVRVLAHRGLRRLAEQPGAYPSMDRRVTR
jgi:RNA polymerase sigma-70 factor (ECF subfamily)